MERNCNNDNMGIGQDLTPSLFAKTETYQNYLQENKASLISDDLVLTLIGTNKEFKNIFYKGDFSLIDKPSASIVGTRNCSPFGRELARNTAKRIVGFGLVVVSGLAKGIDTEAHSETLRLNGKTIAVLGTPIHKIYPHENLILSQQIEKKGLLISTALPDEVQGKWLFPRRNRLMAILSKATIVIEAGEKSGVIHQAAECIRLKKKLIFFQSVVDKQYSWIKNFLNSDVLVIKNPDEITKSIFE